MKGIPRRPATVLTHADVFAALHRCKYDIASAEASLGALRRYRTAKYEGACVASNNEETQDEETSPSATQCTPSVGKAGLSLPSRGKEGERPGGWQAEERGNRWEDWSQADRAAFLTHLGDKVRLRLVSGPTDRFVPETWRRCLVYEFKCSPFVCSFPAAQGHERSGG